MANIAADTILARLRALLDTGVGGRSITSTRFDGDLQPSLPVGENVRRALVRPRCDVQITSLQPSSGSVHGTHHDIYQITVNVRVVRALTAIHVLDDATRDAAIAAASTDADDIAQAFTFENNVTVSTSGVVSGKLELASSTQTTELSTDVPSHVTSEHVFTGWVSVALTAPAHPLFDPVLESTAKSYDSPVTGSIMSGTNTMTWAVVFYQENVTPSNYGAVVVVYRNSIIQPTRLGIYTSAGGFYFRIFDGTNTLYGSATPTLGASYNGKMVTMCWTYNSPTLRTFVNGVQYGGDVTTGGGIIPSVDNGNTCLSVNKDGLYGAGGNRNDALWYKGIAMSQTTALTPAQVLAWHHATVETGHIATYPGVQWLLDMRTNPTLATAWTDRVSSVAWSMASGTSGTVQTPSSIVWST